MRLSRNQHQQNNKNLTVFLLITFVISLATLTSFLFVYAATNTNGDPDTSGPFGFLDNQIIVGVLSTVIVSLITYLLGRLRNVSQTLKEIPTLQASDVELKRSIRELEEQQSKNTELLKRQLEKIDSKIDRRFDNVSEKQSVIERDMNEKIVHLIMSLRNFSGGSYDESYNSNNNTKSINQRGKYKE